MGIERFFNTKVNSKLIFRLLFNAFIFPEMLQAKPNFDPNFA